MHWNNWQWHGNKLCSKSSTPIWSLSKIRLIKDPFDHPGRKAGGGWQASTVGRAIWALAIAALHDLKWAQHHPLTWVSSSCFFPGSDPCHNRHAREPSLFSLLLIFHVMWSLSLYNSGTPLSTTAKWVKNWPWIKVKRVLNCLETQALLGRPFCTRWTRAIIGPSLDSSALIYKTKRSC